MLFHVIAHFRVCPSDCSQRLKSPSSQIESNVSSLRRVNSLRIDLLRGAENISHCRSQFLFFKHLEEIRYQSPLFFIHSVLFLQLPLPLCRKKKITEEYQNKPVTKLLAVLKEPNDKKGTSSFPFFPLDTFKTRDAKVRLKGQNSYFAFCYYIYDPLFFKNE